jgi:tetratricopeptide (TPR) repeat protein
MTILAFQQYRKEQPLEKAVSDFRRWSGIFPRSPWTRIARGHFLIDKGHREGDADLLDQGFAELRRAGELAEGDPIVLQEVSHALLVEGKDEEAIPFLERYMERVPEDAENWRKLVGAYLRTARYAKAIPLMEKLAALHPGDPISWSTLAGAYEAIRQYADAKAALLKALRLDPHNPTFLDTLRELEKAMEPSPPPADALEMPVRRPIRPESLLTDETSDPDAGISKPAPR